MYVSVRCKYSYLFRVVLLQAVGLVLMVTSGVTRTRTEAISFVLCILFAWIVNLERGRAIQGCRGA